MLPRQYRLPATIRFANPRIYTTQYFVVKFSPNNDMNSRFGFVIGKTVVKQAVHRNAAKRLLRSCVEEHRDKIVSGYDMLFLLKKGIIGAEREIVCKEVQTFLEKTKLLT